MIVSVVISLDVYTNNYFTVLCRTIVDATRDTKAVGIYLQHLALPCRLDVLSSIYASRDDMLSTENDQSSCLCVNCFSFHHIVITCMFSTLYVFMLLA